MCKNRNTRLLTRLIIDFLLLIGICFVALVTIPPQVLPTVHRGFFCSDLSLQFPYTESLLHKVHITFLVIAVPAIFILVVEIIRAALSDIGDEAKVSTAQQFTFVGIKIPTFVSECYNIIGVYLFGLALELIMVKVTKHAVGRLRPYFFDVCQPQFPDGSSCADAQNQGRYVVNYTCSELAATPELLNSVNLSFPSAYTTSAAYAMCFLAFYFQARITAAWLKLLRTVLQFSTLTLAALVALERVAAYRHHWTDVLASLAIGLFFAAFVAVCVAQLFASTTSQARRVPTKAKEEQRQQQQRVYSYYEARPRTRKLR